MAEVTKRRYLLRERDKAIVYGLHCIEVASFVARFHSTCLLTLR